MTRKDYVLIAAALKSAHDGHNGRPQALRGVADAADRIAIALARDNPRFDRERFLKAAGVQS